MLPAEGATEGNGELEDLADGLGHLLLPCLMAQIALHDVHVQVAVARMSVAHALETVSPPDLLHAFEQAWQFVAGHDGVLLLVDRVALHRLAHLPPEQPERVLLCRGLREKHLPRPMRLHHLQDGLAVLHERVGVVAVHLHEQVRLHLVGHGEAVIADEAQRPVDGIALHELHRTGRDARPEHGAHRLAGLVRAVERDQEQPVLTGQGHQTQHGLGDDTQRALAADQQPGEVIARAVLQGVGPGPDHLAVRQHHLQVQDEVARDTVLDRPRAAGVLGQVAADRATASAGGVRRIVQALLRHRLLQHLGDHTRLHRHLQVPLIDVHDPVHPVERQTHAPVHG